MRRKGFGWFSCYAIFLALLLGLATPCLTAAQAQQNATVKSSGNAPPAKVDAPPDTEDVENQFKILSHVQTVTTPVTVFDSAGQLVYDLEKDEFQIYDNGEPQVIQGFDTEMNQLALVVIVETNDKTVPFLDAVRPLGSLFSDMVMGPQGQVALLTYSDRVNLALPFTSNGDQLDTALRGLNGRGGGMHLDDALTRAMFMLINRPRGERKVIIVFSDGFNLGSKMSRTEIVRGAMNSDVTIYGLGFSPAKGLWKSQPQDPQPDLAAESVARSMPPNMAPTPTAQENIWDPNNVNIVSILLGIGEEVKKPIFKDSMIYFARYSGGQAYTKWDKSTVQNTLTQIGAELHSQYELSYSPPQPIAAGYHRIEVKVRRPGAKVRARAGWFYQGDVPRGVIVK